MHGGHFYQVSKYAGAPEQLPKTLHWFKWEAYFTWITGVSLLAVVYYFNASMYLVDSNVLDMSSSTAIGLSIASLVGGWIVYDLLCKSPLSGKPVAFTAVGFTLMTAVAFGLCEVFAARAAYIHVGAMMGTMMAANVFFVIIPNQRKMVDAMIAGEEPDTSLGEAGALRSFHNNYFTLPVLFIMISNHFPMTYGHTFNWAILAGISLIGAGIRHWFNLKSKGHLNVWILPVTAFAMLALAFVIRPQQPLQMAQAEDVRVVSYAEIAPIMKARCSPCHAEHPTRPEATAAPGNIRFDTPEQTKALADRIQSRAIDTHTMPLGNVTEMTDEERALVAQWIQTGASID